MSIDLYRWAMTVRLDHGTRNAYTNHGCRCQPCRDAAAAYQRERRGARLEFMSRDAAATDSELLRVVADERAARREVEPDDEWLQRRVAVLDARRALGAFSGVAA